MNAPLLVVTHREVAAESVQTIDSAELHAFLGVTTEHGKWIARRILSYGFVDGTDFLCSPEVAGKGQGRGGHNRAIYHLTLDMAKQLAMVERNAKGRQAREYFIECERRAKAAAHQPAAIAAEIDARFARIESRLAEQGMKAAAFDRLADVNGAVAISRAAKLLDLPPRQLFALLSERGWIFRSCDFGSWQAYQARIAQGLLLHRMVPVVHGSGVERLHAQALITPAGLRKLAELIEAEHLRANSTPAAVPTTARTRR